MRKSACRFGGISLALSLAIVPEPSQAIAPVLLMLVRQIVQDAAKSMVKDLLLSSLSGTGCKGIAIANALDAFELRTGFGGSAGGMMGMLGGGMPKMPGGIAMTSLAGSIGMLQMPASMAILGAMELPAGMSLPAGVTKPRLARMGGVAGMPGGTGLGSDLPLGIPADVAAKMDTFIPEAGRLQGTGLDPKQMEAIAQMQQVVSQPPSITETVATIDEMAELGFLPKEIQAESSRNA